MAHLKFISGPHQGREHVLQESDDVTIGSDPGCDLVLTAESEYLAPRHARMMVLGDQCMVEPLGESLVFINGERIMAPHPLRDGDHVLVGIHIIKYEIPRATTPPPVSRPQPPRREEPRYGRAVAGRPANMELRFLSGDVPLEDIIQLFANSRGTVAIHYAAHPAVAIYMRQGDIHWVSFQDEPDPYIAFARILALAPAEWYADRQWSGEGVVDEPLDAHAEQFLTEVHRRLEERAARLESGQ